MLSSQALATKALKDSPKWKPAKGYKYLEDLNVGSLFKTQSGTRGVLVKYIVDAVVIITESPYTRTKDDSFYLGKIRVSSKTEVKEIKWRKQLNNQLKIN